MAARSAEALGGCSIGPDQEPRELCQRVLTLVQQEAGDDARQPTEDELAELLGDCMRQVSVERLTADPQRWRTQVDCVRVAPTVESLKGCDGV